MSDYLNIVADMTDPDLVSVIDELPLWSAPFGLKLLDTVELRKNIKALDLGCGLGFPLIELSQRLGQTSRVYGIDPWEAGLDRIRLKLRVYNITNVHLVNGTAEKMPFDSDQFDLIVSNNGISNVEDMGLTLKECFRVGKPGAQLVFTFNTRETMLEFYAVFQETLEAEGLTDEVRKLEEHIHLKRKPVEAVKALTEASGFSVNHVSHDAFEMRFVDATAMLSHCLIKYWFMPPWKEIPKPGDLEMIFSRVESALNEQSAADGGLTLTIPYVTFDCRKT